jgi:hypothetical protein
MERIGRLSASVDDSTRDGPTKERRLGMSPRSTPALAMLALIVSVVLDRIQSAWSAMAKFKSTARVLGSKSLYCWKVLLQVMLDDASKWCAYLPNHVLNFCGWKASDAEELDLSDATTRRRAKTSFVIFDETDDNDFAF